MKLLTHQPLAPWEHLEDVMMATKNLSDDPEMPSTKQGESLEEGGAPLSQMTNHSDIRTMLKPERHTHNGWHWLQYKRNKEPTLAYWEWHKAGRYGMWKGQFGKPLHNTARYSYLCRVLSAEEITNLRGERDCAIKQAEISMKKAVDAEDKLARFRRLVNAVRNVALRRAAKVVQDYREAWDYKTGKTQLQERPKTTTTGLAYCQGILALMKEEN